jgi:hypothetical protein
MGWVDLVESEVGEGSFDCEEHGAGGLGGSQGRGAQIRQWSTRNGRIRGARGRGVERR